MQSLAMDLSLPDSGTPVQSLVDGVRSESGANSPTSSTGGHARARQKQVPISRNTGSGYERPERARTSHACEPCRERKTKCDGERPSCRRCLHTGTNCHYGYGKGWKKRKTAEDLTVTSRKLARYEELLNDIIPLVSPDVRNMIEAARLQEFSTGEPLDSSTPNSGNIYESDVKGNSPSLSRLPLPLPASLNQPQPQFTGAQRSLPPPLSLEPSASPLQPTASLSRSPTDDNGGGGVIRLPSITRHGFLVEGAPRGQLGQPGFGPSLESQRSTDTHGTSASEREQSQSSNPSSNPPSG